MVFGTLLTVLWLPINIIYHIFTFKLKPGLSKTNKYFYQLALSVDQFCNVSLSTPLDLLMTKGDFHPFGDEDDTLSYVFAVNHSKNTLSNFGIFWANFLIMVDYPSRKQGTNHLIKTIKNKQLKDKEACLRVNL